MNLTLKVTGERVKAGQFVGRDSQTEPYVIADVALDGSNAFVAATLHALARSIDPNGGAA